MKRTQTIAIILILILITAGGTWCILSVQNPPSPSLLKDITIDPGHSAASTLLIVAKDQGYFAGHGLNVTFVESTSASVSLKNLVNQKIDFGFIHEYTLSEPVLYNKSVRVIGTLAESDVNYVVGRSDRGILEVRDLEGKRIGVTKGSIGEYFLDRFFVLNGLSLRNITVINLQPAQLVDALVGGDIDASFSPEPRTSTRCGRNWGKMRLSGPPT